MGQGTKMFSGVLDKGKTAVHNAKEAVVALPGVRWLDPRRHKLVSDMEKWASNAHLPGYKPFGGLDGSAFIDPHLRRFTERGYPDWRWPPSNGFDTFYPVRPASSVLQPGMSINRISPVAAAEDRGEYASPAGVSFEARSAPPDRLSPNFSSYDLRVLKPLPPEVTSGRIAEAFEQPGGGIQFHFPGGMKYWIDN